MILEDKQSDVGAQRPSLVLKRCKNEHSKQKIKLNLSLKRQEARNKRRNEKFIGGKRQERRWGQKFTF